MATTNVQLNITGNARTELERINKQTENLNKSFGAMKSALAGLALGSFITNIFNAAKDTMDFATATGFATQSVLGLQKAFVANGGTIETANNAIVKLTQNIGEAAQGSGALQSAFAQVGVSLSDLATMSEEEIFLRTIQGLAGIDDAATRTALGLQLLGKAAKTIDYAGIASGAKSYISSSIQQAEAVASVDAASKKLEEAMISLKEAIIVGIKPIADFVNQLNISGAAIQKFIKAALEIGLVIASFTILGKVLRGSIAIVSLIRAAFTDLGKTVSVVGHYIKRALGLITVKNPKNTFIQGIANSAAIAVDSLKVLGGALAAIIAIVVPDSISDGFKKLGQAIGVIPDSATQAADYIDELVNKSTDAWQSEQNNVRKVIEANNSLRQSILKVAEAYSDQITELQKTIALETQAFDISTDQLELDKALTTVTQNNTDAIKALTDQRAKLTEEQKNLIPVIDQQISKLQEQLAVDQATTAAAIQNLQARRLEQDKLNKQLELTRQSLSDAQSLQSLQAQLAVIGQYGDELQQNMMLLSVSEELQRKLTDLEVKRLELENQRTQLGEARFAQEMAHLAQLQTAAYQYADARIEAEQRILAAQKAVQDNAKLGTEQAISDIAKQFEPYNMAQEGIKKGWDAIGNAVDTFVETGKFKFGDFARSVIADLTKMIAKAMIFKAISGIAGAFGLSIPGLAKGGPAKAGQPYIVGEKGPELFVPQGSGTVVPNNKLGQQGVATGAVNAPVTNNYITNNINALDAKSVAQLFAENRKTLLGSVKMAEREMPYAAR